jgi:uncharacterized protein (TIGR02646 family)
MIRLTRTPCPTELTPQLQQELTTLFIADGKAVWDRASIKDGLRAMSSGKCSYCECSLGEESKYLEVEHFADKHSYPNLVVDWPNLLPACKHCNVNKGTHDVRAEPIVDPSTTDPRDHLDFFLYRFRGKTTLGSSTEAVLYLNDPEALVRVRFKIGEQIQETLLRIRTMLQDFINGGAKSVARRNRIIGSTKSVLREGLPTAEYSATVATIVSSSADYTWTKENLKTVGLWDSEVTGLDAAILAIAY